MVSAQPTNQAGRVEVLLPLRRVIGPVVLGSALVILFFELWVGFTTKGWGATPDYDVVMEAARRWLASGTYFLDRQLHGPYMHGPSDVLYPPTALAFFVPFSFLPTAAWYAVPLVVIAAAMWRLRPVTWALAIMAVLACWPAGLLETVSGNPLIFVMAILFASAAWGVPASLVLLKPSLLPFALFHANARAWWIGILALVMLSLPLLPLNLQWLQVVADHQGRGGLLYSIQDAPYAAIALVAWLGRRRPPSSDYAPRLIAG